jgi:hypothetical protein
MRRFLLTILAVGSAALLLAAPASASFGLRELDVTFGNRDGSAALLAGSHPYEMTTTLGVNVEVVPGAAEDPITSEPVDGEVPEGEIKDLTVQQIPGFIGSQTAVPRCSSADFNTRSEGRPACPDSTAVGVVAVKAEFKVFPVGSQVYVHVPLYNLAPSPGQAAKLGFVALNVPIVIDVGISPKPPYNLVANLSDVPQAVVFYGSKLTIWGNPADPTHDSLRGKCVGETLVPTAEPVSLGNCPTNVPEAPFLTMPRSCRGPLSTIFTADSWQSPGAFTEPEAAVTHDDSTPPVPQGMFGCESLTFAPTVEAQPTSSAAEGPAGLDVGIEVTDEGIGSPTGRAKADISKVTLALPEGVTVNPSAAEGMGVCTEAQYQAASLQDQGCPESSKLGSVRVKSPLIEEPLEGALYLAAPRENQFGSLIAFYMLIESKVNGIFIKQAGKVLPDKSTGRLVSTVEDIPELPFSRFDLHFREGPRAPLVTPPTCGSYATEATLYPSSGGEPVQSRSTFRVTSGANGAPCPSGGAPPFAPGFEAGSLNNNAGSYSPFYMRLTRADGQQDMTRFDAVLPPGVTGKIAGVPTCSDAAIAAAAHRSGREELSSPSCPLASQLGHVLVGAGVGPALTWVPGKIYLAGPFGGDPLSLAVITPAVAGPFDVGTVVTREALRLNPTTGQVEVDGSASEPIPHILEGIPLKIRDLRVYVDRPEFTLNPTTCEASAVQATIFGSGADPFLPLDDVPTPVAARFQAANCAQLPFKPKLMLSFKGATKRAGHPALHSVLVPRAGDANIGRAVVTLPNTEYIDNAHINNPCTRVQFNEEKCPASSILGTARAVTPLLDKPLEGPVYFRSNGNERLLPDVVADLRGQFHIVLVGFVKTITPKTNPRLQTTFATVPDAPVKRFELNLFGGKRGLLQNNTNLCARKRHAVLQLTGQNGKRTETSPALATGCKGKKRHS